MLHRNAICWRVAELVGWADAGVGFGAFVAMVTLAICTARNQSCLLAGQILSGVAQASTTRHYSHGLAER